MRQTLYIPRPLAPPVSGGARKKPGKDLDSNSQVHRGPIKCCPGSPYPSKSGPICPVCDPRAHRGRIPGCSIPRETSPTSLILMGIPFFMHFFDNPGPWAGAAPFLVIYNHPTPTVCFALRAINLCHRGYFLCLISRSGAP